MKFTCPLLVAVGACASMVAFCAELPPAVFDVGGVTFDFDAISARTLGPGTGGANVVKPEDSVLPFEKWRPFHWMHTYALKPEDPMRKEIAKGIEWHRDGDICRVVKKPELLGLCGGDPKLVKATDGSFKRYVRLPDDSGGTYRLKLRYRLKQPPDDTLKGRFTILVQPGKATVNDGKLVKFEEGRLKSFWVGVLPGDWPMFCNAVVVPPGMDTVSLWIRLDGVGELSFKDVSLERLPSKEFEMRFTPVERMDGTFVLSRGQPGYVALEWRRQKSFTADPAKFLFTLALPPGVSYLGSNFAKNDSVKIERSADGASKVEFRLRKGKYLTPTFNSDRLFGVVVETDRDGGILGEGRLSASLNGKVVGETAPVRFMAMPPVAASGVPKTYANGVFPGAGVSGLFLDFEDDALVERYARAMSAAGCTWLLDHPLPGALAALRRAGFRRILCETGRLANGFNIHDGETAIPESERFISWKKDGSGKLVKSSMKDGVCPVSVYREKPYFLGKTLPWATRFLEGFDGLWGNWEPWVFSGGCGCDDCRDEFAKYAGIPQDKLAADWPMRVKEPGYPFAKKLQEFRSWQHGQVVRTLERHVRRLTGGKDSLGFMPGMGWLEVGSWWRPHNHIAGFLVKDYADALEWIEPWGPYVWWPCGTPWVYEKRKPLVHFLAAKDMRETVDADYPLPHRPKLASFPHGIQGDGTVTQPERLSMALDSFFFNRWEASIVYFMPRGYDARFWRAFAEATGRAAKYEAFVSGGATRCRRTSVEPVAGAYAANCTQPTAFLPHVRNISPLQCAAFEKDGTRIVAVLNFWEKGEAFFDLKADGLKGEYAIVSEDGTLFAKGEKHRFWDAAELAAGVWLGVGAARTKVFELRPADGHAMDGVRDIMTMPRLQEVFRQREKALRAAAAEDAEQEKQFPPPTEEWSPLI